MKRAAEPDANDISKRPKHSSSDDGDDAFDIAQRISPAVLHDSIERGPPHGHVAGRVFMTWPPVRQTLRFNVEVREIGTKLVRFDVELSGACAPFFDVLGVRSQDEFLISLRGVKVERKGKSSGPGSLPIVLRYKEGVVIKRLVRGKKTCADDDIVDTWKLQADAAAQEPSADDWFSTPPVVAQQPSAVIVARDTSESSPTSAPQADVVSSSTSFIKEIIKHATQPSFHDTSKRKNPDESGDDPPSLHSKKAKTSAEANVVTPPNKPVSTGLKSVGLDTVGRSSTGKPLCSAMPAPVVQRPDPEVCDTTVPGPQAPKVKLTRKEVRRLRKRKEAAAARASVNVAPTIHTGPVQAVVTNEVSSAGPSVITSLSTADPEPAVPSSLEVTQRVQIPTDVPASEPSRLHQIEGFNEARCPGPSIEDQDKPERKPEKKPDNQPQDRSAVFKTGFSTESGEYYTPLGELRVNKFCNVIGVVISAKPITRTQSGELHRYFTICDSSNYDAYSNGVGVNCFTAQYESWLPAVECGRVVILHQVKVEKPLTTSILCTGLKDRLMWAVFDPNTKQVHYGDQEGVPQEDGLADGYGYVFSPFWRPGERELLYCVQIMEWWKEVSEAKEKSLGTMVQIGDKSNISIGAGASWSKREHRLICDAGPSVPPNGFFNCTVEVLHGHDNSSGPYSLYVTDYTLHNGGYPIQAGWCPSALGDHILRIELWGAAAKAGRSMQPGEYYYLNNVKMKISGKQYVEATMTYPDKLRKLDENHIDHECHLQALLVRKKEWEEKIGSNEAACDPSKHRLLNQGTTVAFFNCTVEVLLAQYQPKYSFLYVTDYSYSSTFGTVPNKDAWPHGLDGRVVTIVLRDGQAEMAKAVEPGCIYFIQNLNLKKRHVGDGVQGKLGGEERLIQKLKTRDSDNEHLRMLMQRKEEWSAELARSDAKSIPRDLALATTTNLPGKSTKRCYRTIKEILASDKCPNKFRLVARVVSLFPFSLEEYSVLHCTKCQTDISRNLKGCLECDDMVDSYAKWFFRFFLRLEDEDGSQLHVVVDDKSSLLQGLTAVDLRDHPDSRKELVKRLAPLLGNLAEVRQGIERNERVMVNTPKLELVVDSWTASTAEADGHDRAYGLVSCGIVA